MTAETDLLPLPDVKCWRAMKDRNGNVGYSDKPDPRYSESAGTDGLTWVRLDDHRAALQSYARACVSSATEALRAERQAWFDQSRELAVLCRSAEARAEQLAEALRESAQHLRNHADNEYQMRFEDNSPSGRLNRLLMLADRIEANVARAALEQETTNG